MDIWQTEEPNADGFVEDSWVAIRRRMPTSTKILVRLTDPCVMKGGRRSTNHRAVNQTRVAGDTQSKRRGPTRRHDKPGHPRATPENRADIVKQNNKEDDDRQRLAMAAGIAALPSNHPQVALTGKHLPNPTPTSTRTTAAATPTPTTAKTARQAVARHITPMPCSREIRRLHEMGVRTLDNQRQFREPSKAPRVHQPICVCVAENHHATSCRVDLHGVVTSRVLRGQRKGPLRLSIGPAMVVRKDFKRRRGNTM